MAFKVFVQCKLVGHVNSRKLPYHYAANLFQNFLNLLLLNFQGLHECQLAGQFVKKIGLKFDKAYTSLLSRAQITLSVILEESDQRDSVEVHRSYHLNERHYGALTGLDKNVIFFNRTFDERPAPMKSTHPYWQSIVANPLYSDLVATGTMPRAESLQDTLNRIMPYWNTTILPDIRAGKRIIIATHGNVLRSLFQFLDNSDKQEAANLFMEYSVPIIYEFDEHFNVVISKQNLY